MSNEKREKKKYKINNDYTNEELVIFKKNKCL